MVKIEDVTDNQENSPVQNKEPVVVSLVSRALLMVKAKPEDWSKDEVEHVFFWMRVVLAAVVGAVCGIVPVTGVKAILTFLFLFYSATAWYYEKLQIPDHIASAGFVFQNGLQGALMNFLFVWIVFYTIFSASRSLPLGL